MKLFSIIDRKDCTFKQKKEGIWRTRYIYIYYILIVVMCTVIKTLTLMRGIRLELLLEAEDKSMASTTVMESTLQYYLLNTCTREYQLENVFQVLSELCENKERILENIRGC